MVDSKKIYVGVGDYKTNAKIRKNVLEVLDSGRLSYGPFISKFESEFSNLHDSNYGIMCNSGTSALQVALETLKITHNWNEDDEVIVPATTFVATANIVLQCRLKPVFVDVEPEYFGINPDLIKNKITSKTRCIIPVHLFGMPCQMDKIMSIAKEHGLKVIEDSCETMFAEFNGKKVGSFGDISCFSTYIAHILITGVGGIMVTSNHEYAITMRSLINHGRDSIYMNIDDDKMKTKEKMKEIIERRFSFVHCGYSYRASELEGAIGLAQLENWQENIRTRQNNASFLTDKLSLLDHELQLPKVRPLADHVFMMYPIVLKKEHKQDLCNYLESFGVETRDMLPLINQPFYKPYFQSPETDYPISDKILKSGFYIGCHPYMTSAMLHHVVKVFQGYFVKVKTTSIPSTAALVVITSSDKQITTECFSKINPKDFNQVLIFDQHNTFDPALIGEQKNTEIIKVHNASLLEIYKSTLNKTNKDYIVFHQLNGSQDPKEIGNMLSHIKLGYDLVIASRFLAEGKRYDDNHFIPMRGLGNRLTTFILNMAFNGNLVDSYQPYRAVSRKFLETCSLNSRLLPNYQMSIKAVKLSQRVLEIPTQERNSIDPMGLLQVIGLGLLTIYWIIVEKFQNEEKID